MTSFFTKPRVIFSLLLLFIFLTSVGIKIFLFTQLTVFNYHDDTGLFWTESAFQYRYARMVANQEPLPSTDYKIQYPEGLEVFSHITIAMELVSGYLYRSITPVFPDLPFHVFLIYFICTFSSLSVFAVYFLSQEIWGNRLVALLSSMFYAFSSVSIDRTIGQFTREDFCLPFIFFGLYFFAIAQSDKHSYPSWLQKRLAPILSGTFIFIALSSWHFSRFYFLIFTLLVIITFFTKKDSRTLVTNFILIIIFSLLASLTIPVLKEKSFFTSYPMIWSYCLIGVYWLQQALALSKRNALVVFIVSVVLSSFLLFTLTNNYVEYSHVYSLLLYKLKYFGIKPDDPTHLPYSARVLWIEAFNSPSLWRIVYSFSTLLPIGAIFLSLSIKDLMEKKTTVNEGMLLYFTLVFFGLYLLIIRMSVFLIFFLSVSVGRMLIKQRKEVYYPVLLLLFVCVTFEFHKSLTMRNPTLFKSWTKKLLQPKVDVPPYGSLRDRIKMIDWIRDNTEKSDVILAWFGTGPMVATDTGRLTILHSKFESEKIRNKYQEFAFSLFDNEENFFAFCEKYQADYFLYEPQFVLDNSKDSIRYLTNQRSLRRDTTAYMLHFVPERLNHFSLAYQNSSFRLYKIVPQSVSTNVSQAYQPLFDIKQFENLPDEQKFFDDSKTEEVIRKRYYGKMLFVQGVMSQEHGKPYKATEFYKRAIALVPDLIEAYLRLANIYCEQGFCDKGVALLKRAIQIDPNQESLYQRLAWIYATSPDALIRNGEEAVPLAKKACELTEFKKGAALDTLAAAYAEQGNFKKAVEYQLIAVKLATPLQEKEFQKRIHLYRSQQPYRDQKVAY